MDPGELRHRITFFNPVRGNDPNNGSAVITWVQSVGYWAKVEFQTVGSSEEMIRDKLTPITAVDVTLRYFEGITKDMEIEYLGLRYKIVSILPDIQRCFVKLETIQVGELRDQGLAESDGEILEDSSGIALVLGDGDVAGNYQPPGLTFLNSDEEEFTP